MSSRWMALGALVAAVASCGNEAKSPSSAGGGGGDHAEVGKPAPELAVETLNDKGKISLKELEGKVVIVDFWATWCGPCKQSFPKLEELSKKVNADKVVIVGISVDDDKKGVAEFAKENGATFPIGWDEGHKIAKSWKVSNTMPTTFVVDPTGKIRHIHDGYHDGETATMEKEANALLAEGSGDTKVAKNEAKTDEPKTDAKTDAKGDAKSDSAKGDEKTDEKTDEEPTTTKKKPPKKKKPKKKK